ncbi:MAG: hypothetical protein JSR85_03630 [Proteobacteria bacterium]|nr:hypothetical protein [Pseudomonadota bacterium]
MKFHISILLSFLSTSAILNSPAMSMPADDMIKSTRTVPLKAKMHLTAERGMLKVFLDQNDYPGAFIQIKAGLPPHVSDEEIVNFLMTSNKYPNWDRVNPEDKTWVVTKITKTARRKDLVIFLSQKDYPDAFIKIKTGLPPHVSDEEIVNFLMTSNKYPNWDRVNPEDKTWVVAKITKTARRKDLEVFLSQKDYPDAFIKIKAGLPPHVSDEEIVNFLMTSNKYPDWDRVDPDTKRWVVARITGKPIETALNQKTIVAKPTAEAQELADTLKKLNPNMENIIANAWADLANDNDLSSLLGEHYSDEDLTYTFQRPGNPVRVPYYQHLMPRHELSGYYALNLTPKRVVELIEASLAPEAPGAARRREIIAEKLIADLREGKFPEFLRGNKEIMHFQEQVIAKEEEVNSWVKTFNAFLKRGIPGGREALQANDLREELFIDLPEELPGAGLTVSEGLFFLHLAKEDLAQHRANLNNVFRNDRLLLDYITTQIPPRGDILANIRERRKEFIVTVIADILNCNLNIYQPVIDAPHNLELAQSYITPGAANQINLLYSNGHFDRLETRLHRHVVPATEFQDPFAQFRGREATGGALIAIGEELKNIDRILFPEGIALRKELHDLVGYDDDANKFAFIEGYQAEEQRKGRYITQIAAEAEYNRKVRQLEDRIAAGENIAAPKKTPTFIYTHLSKAFGGDTPIAKELENALETMAICTLPKIVYLEGIKVHNQGMIRRTIFEHWDKGYTAFEIREDGLYGTKAAVAAPKTFEKLLKFIGGKVEAVQTEVMDEGIQRFYLRDPNPDDIRIFDEMLVDVKRLCPTLYRAVSLINDVKRLFEMRPALLEQAARGIYNELNLTSHMVHLSFSDPNNRYDYDRVSAQHRLNNIHNSIVQSYITAKKRGDESLKRYFNKTMAAPSYCLDGASRDFHDYMRDVLEKDAPAILPKEKFIEEKLNELIKLPVEPTKASIRAAFRRFLNAPTLEGPFGARDIDKAIEMADEWGIL